MAREPAHPDLSARAPLALSPPGPPGSVPARGATATRDDPAAFAWICVASVLFATMNYCARRASGTMSWELVGAARAIIGAGVAIAVARTRGASLVIHDKKAMWRRSALGTVAMTLTFWALGTTGLGLGDTATLLNLAPVLIALLGPIMLREHAGPGLVLALGTSGLGVMLILRPAFLFGGPPAAKGALITATLAVLAACFSALAMIALRRLGPKESPEAVSTHFSLTAAGALTLLALPHLSLPNAKDALYMVLAGVTAGIAQIAMTRAYALARAAKVASVGYLNVVASAMWGAWALGEWPRASAIGGMALVIAGGLVTILPSLAKPRVSA